MYRKILRGGLRDTNAMLYDSDIEVPEPREAMKYMNSFIASSKEIITNMDNMNIFDYIEEAVKITTDLIRVQPFPDGNKRTFRALLNLMLKRKKLPPIYVETEEKEEYKELLMEALKGKYDRINKFYFYKICNSIVELDLNYKNKISVKR